jgi:hypothetical protein
MSLRTATKRRTHGLARSMILETKPAWGTAKGIFRNDHAPKMRHDTGGEQAQECPIVGNS